MAKPSTRPIRPSRAASFQDGGKEDVDAAVALPEYLTSPDGRCFLITNWTSEVPMDGMVEVSADLFVKLDDPRADCHAVDIDRIREDAEMIKGAVKHILETDEPHPRILDWVDGFADRILRSLPEK